MVATYTTAEEAYDGFGTTTIDVVGRSKNGKTIRKVHTPEPHVRWQRMRYGSGLHMALDEAGYRDLLAHGLVDGLGGKS